MIGLGEPAKILFDGNDVVVPDGVAYTDLIFLADSQSHGGGDNRSIWCNTDNLALCSFVRLAKAGRCNKELQIFLSLFEQGDKGAKLNVLVGLLLLG